MITVVSIGDSSCVVEIAYENTELIRYCEIITIENLKKDISINLIQKV